MWVCDFGSTAHNDHLTSASLSRHGDNLSTGRATNHGVIYKAYGTALKFEFYRAQLSPHTLLADLLFGNLKRADKSAKRKNFTLHDPSIDNTYG